jgi:hypothetical protein
MVNLLSFENGRTFAVHSGKPGSHFLVIPGIHLGFLSDGYPPETAGMTEKRWIPATKFNPR